MIEETHLNRRGFLGVSGATLFYLLTGCDVIKGGDDNSNSQPKTVDNRFFKNANSLDELTKDAYRAKVGNKNDPKGSQNFKNFAYAIQKDTWNIIYPLLSTNGTLDTAITNLLTKIGSEQDYKETVEFMIEPDYVSKTATLIIGVKDTSDNLHYGRFLLSPGKSPTILEEDLYNAAVGEMDETSALNLVKKVLKEVDSSYVPSNNSGTYNITDTTTLAFNSVPIAPDLRESIKGATVAVYYHDPDQGTATDQSEIDDLEAYILRVSSTKLPPLPPEVVKLIRLERFDPLTIIAGSPAPDSGDGALYIAAKSYEVLTK